ncbi:MAG: CmcI family methyltransferase [Acidobacteria bacterium]|nr:CmcI family methyltransferase [Acidobacteriota bacterium]
MKLVADTAARTLTVENGESATHDLYSRASFEHISRQWVRIGWSLRYYSGFTWMGLPVLQLPDDLVRFQEVIWDVRPSLVIETGVYQGGSLLFHASLCKAIGAGRVVGVDINVPSSLREAISDHMLGSHITLIEGDSASPEVSAKIERLREPGETTLVLLDSDHSRAHVRRELEAYAPLVTPGSYLIVADTIVRDLADVPGGDPSWAEDNPAAAVEDFLAAHPEFERAPRVSQTSVENLPAAVSYWQGGWLRRRP